MAEKSQSYHLREERCRSVLQQQVTICVQNRAREQRELRTMRINNVHRHIINHVAIYTNMDVKTVIDFICDTDEQLALLENFCKADGCRSLAFYYQDTDSSDWGGACEKSLSSCSRVSKGRMHASTRLFVVDCHSAVPLTGDCLYFIRKSAKSDLILKTISDDLLFGVFDASKGLLIGVHNYIDAVMKPALQAAQDWGAEGSNVHIDVNQAKRHLMDEIDTFLQYLESTQTSIDGTIQLEEPGYINLSKCVTVTDCNEVASCSDKIAMVEHVVLTWCKQLDLLLTASGRMRKEADTTGPIAELEHWRNLAASFNAIVDQIKGHQCRMAICILHIAKSKVLRRWQEFDKKITDAANEAKDNVKYLYTLERFYGPLYHADPITMSKSIPSLVNAINMIQGTSRYYNTSERMTSFFMKVTNQTLRSCKSYITNGGTTCIWEQEGHVVLEKLRACTYLYDEYKTSLQRAKQKTMQIQGSSGGFSERNVFGKFDAFCKRLGKIDILLRSMDHYSALIHSNIEGLDGFATRLKLIFDNMKTMPYDLLDFRKHEFDDDFEDVEENIDVIRTQMKSFMDKSTRQVKTTIEALKRLQKFEQLKIPGLIFDENYSGILTKFSKEMSQTRHTYNKYKDNVPLARNMPPVAGRITWVRQLYRKIREPMDIFCSHHILMKSEEGRRVAKTFNKTATLLLEYEVMYHRAWATSLGPVNEALRAPLFVRHPESDDLLVNFDPYLFETIRETDVMLKMGLELPEIAKALNYNRTTFKLYYDKLNLLLSNFNAFINDIPPLFTNIMYDSVEKVKLIMREGIVHHTWTSVNVDQFIAKIEWSLKDLSQLLKQIYDLKTTQIDNSIDFISACALHKLPEKGTWTIDEFIQYTSDHCDQYSRILDNKSRTVEAAANTIMRLFMKRTTLPLQPGRQWITKVDVTNLEDNEINLWEKCSQMLLTLNQRNTSALVKTTRGSLDALRRRLIFGSMVRPPRNNIENELLNRPIFTADVILEIPNIIAIPSLKDIQLAANKAAKLIIETSRGIAQWGQERCPPPDQNAAGTSESAVKSLTDREISPQRLKNYYKIIAEQKDVNKTYSMMGSSITRYKDKVDKALDDLYKYSEIWCSDKESAVIEFLSTDPVQTDFKDKILEYDVLLADIESMPKVIVVGPIALYTAKLKLALSVEIKDWQMMYARQLYLKYQPIVMAITKLVEDEMKNLSRPRKSLEDVRHVMSTLERIRHKEVDIELLLRPIEEAYTMLVGFGITIPCEEANKVDGLRYLFSKLTKTAYVVMSSLVSTKQQFHDQLIESVDLFLKTMAIYENDYNTYGPMAEGIHPQDASDRLNVFQNRFEELCQLYDKNSAGEEMFGLPKTQCPNRTRIKKELSLLQRLYSLYNSVTITVNGYNDILWKDIDIEFMKQQLGEFQKRCNKLPKAVKQWPAFLYLKKQVDDYLQCCPLLELITDKDLVQRHWDRISIITGHTFDIESETFCMRDVMDSNILEFAENIQDICISAKKEHDIEAKIKLVIDEWSNQNLQFSHFKSRGEIVMKPQETSEVIALLEDSLVTLASLMSNRYNAPYKKLIQTWVQNLSTALDITEDWMHVQNNWVYLEAIFIGGDIAKKLPQEAKRFTAVDNSWVKIMHRAHEVRNVINCCVFDDTLADVLPHLLEQLEICQKSLSGYLEIKRTIFPRFCFVSDPVLLEILGHASDPTTIQHHMCSIFANIASVDFTTHDVYRITHVVSREGERLELKSGSVVARGNVEFWLLDLIQKQRETMHRLIREAYYSIGFDSGFDIITFLQECLCQVGLLSLQLIWTRDAEEALFSSRNDKRVLAITNRKFNDLLNKLIQTSVEDITPINRKKFETIITLHVHQRDIFDGLAKSGVRSPTDFEWQKQSRFYFKEDTCDCLMSITDVFFIYQNEFHGCSERLVITPLTDRCYITIAQALKMTMGAAPEGPAGTGKTETIKDMGKSLGKYVVVFNCSDQMDFRGLGRIFKGLAMSGTWGCFDEFNRIQLHVLSVAAGQIYSILAALRERKKEFIFTDGCHLFLDLQCGVFTTMNPGYIGRQVLPENLKVQFRTVAMMVPDRQIIIRVKLASCGFLENIVLAQKFNTLYKLCEVQLSKQVHYDFGLRNVLSVLRKLSSMKMLQSHESEKTIVMRVLRNMNLSKLIDEDEPLFLGLIEDLFPSTNFDCQKFPKLEQAIDKNIAESNLMNHPPWHMKIMQLYETSLTRHGIMVLGPSGSGKSCCIETLAQALTDIGQPHKDIRMNPKAITASQMFGRLDVATNDWTDGIFSTIWRRCLKLKKADHTWWITLDGPVDSVWIENLNSVLDDNKTLTLANGDRLPMSPNSKVLFEVHDLDNASPATVSRNGMVFMSSSVLEWKPILDGWLKTRNQRETYVLGPLFDNVFDDLYEYVSKHLNSQMAVHQCNYITQACNILEALAPLHDDHHALATKTHLERLFVFTIMWSLGALLEQDDRSKLEQFMRDHRFPLSLPVVKAGESIFEFAVNGEGGWEHWSQRVQQYQYPMDHVPEYSSILVPNVDNIRTTFLVNIIATQEKPVLLIGEQGTAKSVMIKNYMCSIDTDKCINKNINLSSATTPLTLQRTFENYLEKRVGSTYGPPGGRKMNVFIDDISMPVINEWGDQVTNELLRQVIEARGFYNLRKPGDFTNIVDIQILAAMIHPGGGRNDIPERLKRHFSIFNCTLPSNSSIDCLFGAIGNGYFCTQFFCEEVCSMITKLIPATRVLMQLTKDKMLPTPAKFHYVFNLRDLSRIWHGMLHIRPQECSDTNVLMALWKHECTRVLADRFTSEQDTQWFEKTLTSVVATHLGDDVAALLPDEIHFVDFLRDAGTTNDLDTAQQQKVYESADVETITERLKYYVGQYNANLIYSKLHVVFFEDCVSHMVRMSRILRTTGGSALLIGVGGSGKQCATKLASFIAGYKVFKIKLSKLYNESNFIEDLKYLYKVAGVQGQGITFIFSDNDIKEESYLEYLNNILGTGEVSNLFTRDELDNITESLIPALTEATQKKAPSQDEAYEYFITRVRNNLHIVLSFSPIGENFRRRALKFPKLLSGCTLDWYHRWPKDALIAVSINSLTQFDIITSHESKCHLMQFMGEVHDGMHHTCQDYYTKFTRQTHVTPPTFLSFLSGYKYTYQSKYNYFNNQTERMDSGLNKLIEAAHSLDYLSTELALKEQELVQANTKADEVLNVVTSSAQAAEQVKVEVQTVKDKAAAIVDDITVDKAYAEEKLEKARPAIEAAEAALLTIKPSHIATVKKLPKPPHLIMRIMDCALLLFQKKMDPVVPDPERPCPKPSWGESLKMISYTSFLTSLVNFPKDVINDEIVELMAPYLEMDDYTFESARKVCGDVAGLLSWTVAMVTFHEINSDILPLKANLAVQENRLQLATRELALAQTHLDEMEQELDSARQNYDGAMREKQILLNTAEMCKRKMETASTLIEGLAGEKERWTEQSKEFKSQIVRLAGDAVLLAAFLSYAGPFNQGFRSTMQLSWEDRLETLGIPFTEKFNVVDFFMDKSKLIEWHLQGLPNDEHSIQNGIIVTEAELFPLIIDPQGQGKTWIIQKEVDQALMVTSIKHKYFRTHLEDALSLGRPLLIENIDEYIDHILDNVLRKNFTKTGLIQKVKIGDKECDVMPGFYLYLTTNLPNPTYSPEISGKTSIVDFTVTQKGLEDQLLGRVIVTEKRDLESTRITLLEDVAKNDRTMKELEDNLLHKLTSTRGSLVDDESLVAVLQVTRATAEDIGEKLVIAAETKDKITQAREEFRPAANRGSLLYFLICEMSMVNCMYQTSIHQFLDLFDMSLTMSKRTPVIHQRTANITDYLTYAVYKYTCRGLYETHRFLYTLLLALKIDLMHGLISQEEFEVFIYGGAGMQINTVTPKPAKWIPDTTWLNLVMLSNLPKFSEILTQIQSHEKSWKAWLDKDAPETEIIPNGYDCSLDTFWKLLLIRAWCPDRVISQARKYICLSLGTRYTEPVILNLEKTWGESTNRTPIICLLSTGYDPTGHIENLSKKMHKDYQAISMGQGQELHARNLVRRSMEVGGWVLLQNGHLGLDFMNALHDMISKESNIHPDFRVWLTAQEHDRFSRNLLQSSIKFTNEPPTGISASLKRRFAGMSNELLEFTNMTQWRPLLYTVSFLHTAIQERRKYGHLGWNIPYEFNNSDWLATIMFLQNHMDDIDPRKGVSWCTVRYMIGEVQYGGRITDEFDMRIMTSLVRQWFGEHTLKDSFCFYDGYPIPSNMETTSAIAHFVSGLPAIDTPEVFGLHHNADISYHSAMANDILRTIVDIQPKHHPSGHGELRESVVYRYAGEMLSMLPQEYKTHDVNESLKGFDMLLPMNTFLKQELHRMQLLLSVVKTTLTQLQLAIDGTIVMNSSLRDILDNLFNSRVPKSWVRVSWESTTIGFWFTELLDRYKHFQDWLTYGRPLVFWMSGFFNPKGFVTAMRQEATRLHKGWALDCAAVHSDVLKISKEEVQGPPVEGVLVYGLFLEGAAWDKRNGRLVESSPKVIFTRLPVIHIYAVNSAFPKDSKLYQCPIYKKPRRTKSLFVTYLALKTNHNPDKWILRGVAALCSVV